ncbi:hypothetical protein V500_05908 [Pseudogymnoascus sp. VKM F-4518 (FW-2643)]|nr:hypothetical protein V500_05908 [Pseudogymnoascus sp. VKM F-4518 (FW-2643)]
MEMQVIETRQGVLGHEHPDTLMDMEDTLMDMDNLAFILKSQSRNKEAISLMETCFQLKRPSTLIQQLSTDREEGFRDAENKAEDLTAADDEDFFGRVGKGIINIPEEEKQEFTFASSWE